MHQDVVGLVRQAQAGSLSAFSGLYEYYFNRVYRYMLGRVADTAEAEDLTQELFLKVMTSLKHFRFKGPPFDAWLFTIARNLVIDWVRRKTRFKNEVTLAEIVELGGEQNVESDSLLALDHQEVVKAMSRLTEFQREVVLLRFIGELSISETAVVMQKNENAVKALQHSALGALRRVLGDQLREVGA